MNAPDKLPTCAEFVALLVTFHERTGGTQPEQMRYYLARLVDLARGEGKLNGLGEGLAILETQAAIRKAAT